MIKVFHSSGLPFERGDELLDWARKNRKQYSLVAIVSTNDLEKAWGLTNSFKDHWSSNKGVRAVNLTPNQERSSSVGDIFSVDGEEHVVMSAGFEKL